MKTLTALAAALVLSLAPAHAELSASHRAAIEKLIELTQVQKQFETSLAAGFESGLGNSLEQIKTLPQEQQDKFNNAITKVKAVMVEMLGWEKMKPDFIEVYGRAFTEKEAAEVATMLDSPTGRLLVAKQIGMITDVMTLTQDKMKTIMPQIMQIMQQEMQK